MQSSQVTTHLPTKLALALTLLVSISSCRTVRQIEPVTTVTHDTIIMSHQTYDSIYTRDTATCQYHIGTIDTTVIPIIGHPLRVDTIYKDRLRYTYRYKHLRDTTYINRVDSIPVIKTIEVEKQVKYVPWYTKTLAWIGAIVLLLVTIFIIYKLTKHSLGTL